MWCKCIGSDGLIVVVWMAGRACFDCSCLCEITQACSCRGLSAMRNSITKPKQVAFILGAAPHCTNNFAAHWKACQRATPL